MVTPRNRTRLKGRKLANNRTAHALKRARERYAIELTHSDLVKIKRMIQTRQSTTVLRTSNSRVVHDLTYAGRKLRCVYSSATGQIITFLPLNGNPEDEGED